MVNQAGATLDIQTDRSIQDGAAYYGGSSGVSPNSILNNGVITKSAGISTADISVPLTGAGDFDVQSGTLGLTQASSLSGDLSVSDAATLRFGSGYGGYGDGSDPVTVVAASGSINGSGTLEFANGSSRIDGNVDIATIETNQEAIVQLQGSVGTDRLDAVSYTHLTLPTILLV